jgi:hypothetical protein
LGFVVRGVRVLYLGLSLVVILVVVLVLLNLRIVGAARDYPARPLYLLIAEFLFLLQVVLVGVRLYVILNRGLGYGLSMRELVEVSVAQTFASLIVPGFYVGGEAVSLAYLTSRGIPTSRATEGIVLRYTVDSIVVTMIVVSTAVLRVPVPPLALGFSIAIFLGYLVLFIAIVNAGFGRYMDGVLRWVSVRFRALGRYMVLDPESRRMRLGVAEYSLIFTLSLAQWASAAGCTYYIFLSLDAPIGFGEALMVVSAYVVLTYVSLLPGSAGIGELANLYILNNLALGEYYLGYVIWFRVLTYLVPLILFLPIFLRLTHSLGLRRVLGG